MADHDGSFLMSLPMDADGGEADALPLADLSSHSLDSLSVSDDAGASHGENSNIW